MATPGLKSATASSGSIVRLGALARRGRGRALVSVIVGLAVFVLTYVGLRALQVTDSAAPSASPPGQEEGVIAADSLAREIHPGRLAVAVPAPSLGVLTSEFRPGDRVDVVAQLPDRGPGTSESAVVARGAVVLRSNPRDRASPLVLEVTPEETIVLAHLVQSGAPLSYALWPAGGAPPTAPRVLELRDARPRSDSPSESPTD